MRKRCGVSPEPRRPAEQLRSLFERIIYRPADRWGEAVTVATDGVCNIGPHAYASQAVLLPVYRQATVAGYDGDPLET